MYSVGWTQKQDDLLYETKGWYSRTVVLWVDPEFIVRVGGQPSLLAHPPDRYVALAFYHHGSLTKQYFVSELVKTSDLERSTSSYRYFTTVDKCRVSDGVILRMKTTAGEKMFFNFTTGERVPGAGSVCPEDE